MSRKNRNKKKCWSRRRRKLMQASSSYQSADKGMILELAETKTETAVSPEIDTDKQAINVPTPAFSPSEFDEAKQREIKSHLKTVLLVSTLCLISVGFLYLLELRINWIEQILGMSP